MMTYEQGALVLIYALIFVNMVAFVVGYVCYKLGHAEGYDKGVRDRRRIDRKVRRGEFKRLA